MNHLHRLLAATSVIALLGAGCFGSPSPSGSTPASPGTTASRGSACESAYYPLKEGSSILYTSYTGGTEVPFKIAVLEHDGANIKLQYDITVQGRVAHINQELVCENGAIRGKGYFDFMQAFTGLDISYDVLEMSGEIFPSNFRVGSEWNTKTKVKINTADTGTIGRMMNGMIASTSIASKVVAEESVTVPAGTFTAMKVEQTVTMDQTIGGRPVHNVTQNTAWYVKDVGLVKTSSGTGANAFRMEAKTIEN
ncbi:hypothetical protein K8R04_03025 [Candidatus Uhrbacteria bacterium]|nr:hypothetical protein [Candidatus Uhrbacteria bacterium]